MFDFYQYFINVDDRDVGRFLKLFTFLPLPEIERLTAVQGAELRAAKQVLAFEATRIVHGDEAAETGPARAPRRRSAAAGATPACRRHGVTAAELAAGLKIVDLLAACGLAASKSAARRLVEQGGVRVGDRKVGSVDDVLKADEVGARRGAAARGEEAPAADRRRGLSDQRAG